MNNNKSMNQNIVWLLVLAVCVLGVYWLTKASDSGQVANLTATSSPAGTLNTISNSSGNTARSAKPAPAKTATMSSPLGSDFRNATYSINGVPVKLVNGMAVTPEAPGSAANVITQVFGNEAVGDLNGDGSPDAAFLLTQASGGSGTFYYVAAALKTLNGYKGTNAILIGDRIAPQQTNIGGGEVIVNYVDRAPGQPMTATPSVGKSRYFTISKGVLTAQ